MSKLNELSILLDTLSDTGTKLTEAAEALKAYFSSDAEEATAPVKEEPVTVSDPEKPVSITFEEVRKVLAELSAKDNKKYRAEVKALVAKYSSNGALKGVPEESYEALLKEAEVINNA